MQFHTNAVLLIKPVKLGSKGIDALLKIKADLVLGRQIYVNRLKLRGEGEFIPQLAAYVGHVHLHLLARSLYGKKRIQPIHI